MGSLVDEDQPSVWRGPIVTQALNQLMFQTNWRDLDYLIVDMPPGTGDIQLTLGQKIPVTGAIIVSTPQDIALIDARKGLKMFEKVSIAILGVVENMSTFSCPECGHKTSVFGEGGAADMAEQFDVPLLGRLPLNAAIRLESDAGRPSVVAEPDGEVAREFLSIARNTAEAVARRPKDYKGVFPDIVVEKKKE
jgi:ATP-binding protein involved in chromosome partitioning